MKGILRSATLVVGLLLSATAFIAYLALGNALNPPPYQVLVALQDIPRYTQITQGMLAVDAQHVHERVARGYVLKGELDSYLGAVAIEPIHAGEPLTKMRLVTGANAMARKRLSLALEDAGKVAMVIPVSRGQCPSAIYPGDYVNITFGVGNAPPTGGRAGEDPEELEGLSPLSASALHPYLEDRAPAITSTQVMAPPVDAEQVSLGAPAPVPPFVVETVPWEERIALAREVMLPLAKTVVRDCMVLNVRRELQANPRYAAGAGGDDVPPYVEGPVQALDILIPADAQELVAFAIENGSLHISLLPHLAHDEEEDLPTLGMTWQDVLDLFYQERLASIKSQMVSQMTIPTPITATASIAGDGLLATGLLTPSLAPSQQARRLAASTAMSYPAPTPVIGVNPGPSLSSTGQGLACLVGGAVLAIILGGIIFLVRRRSWKGEGM